jgi:lysophospholipase L1-like esterase
MAFAYRVPRRPPTVLAFPLLLALAGCAGPAPKADDPWDRDIRAFEERDRQSPPAPGGIVFVGSSSIRLWDLAASFPDLPAVNRGFGGSQLADSVRFAPRIVIPHRPRTIVLYAGDNDIASGKSPHEVARDFRSFVALVLGALPQARIVYISIKPSVARWHLSGRMREANDRIRAACSEDARLRFVDVWPAMLGADGKPRPELLVEDGLHLNPEGYRIWADLVRPHL